MTKLTKADQDFARKYRRFLQVLASAPNGTGAINVVLPRGVLSSIVKQQMAEQCGTDTMGNLYRLNDKGRAALADGDSQ